MRIKAGPSHADRKFEREVKRIQQRDAEEEVKFKRHRYLSNWHWWFAWFPVRAYTREGGYHYIWLERVLRKGIYVKVSAYAPTFERGDHWNWIYSTVVELVEGTKMEKAKTC